MCKDNFLIESFSWRCSHLSSRTTSAQNTCNYTLGFAEHDRKNEIIIPNGAFDGDKSHGRIRTKKTPKKTSTIIDTKGFQSLPI